MNKLFIKAQNAIAARRNDEEGAAMVEYGMLVAGIALVAVRWREGARPQGQRAVQRHHRSDVLTGMRERSPVGDRSCCPNVILPTTGQRRRAMKKPTRDDRGQQWSSSPSSCPCSSCSSWASSSSVGPTTHRSPSRPRHAKAPANWRSTSSSATSMRGPCRRSVGHLDLADAVSRDGRRPGDGRRQRELHVQKSPSCPASAPRPSRRRESCDAVSDTPPPRGPRRRARLGAP